MGGLGEAPSGFVTVEARGAQALARPEAEGWVRYCFDRGLSLHAAAASDRKAEALSGRFPVYVIPAKVPSGHVDPTSTRWAVRHYGRGGRVFATLLGDRYLNLGASRPLREIRTSEALRAAGIPTPRVMAAALYPGGLFYRADLVTTFLSDTVNLVEGLFDDRRKGPGGAADRLDALRAAGSLVRVLGQHGVRHRDLNARNVLLEWKGAAPRAHILDLDRCDVAPEGTVSPRSMMNRLRHSLRKWERKTGLRLSEKEWAALETAIRVG